MVKQGACDGPDKDDESLLSWTGTGSKRWALEPLQMQSIR